MPSSPPRCYRVTNKAPQHDTICLSRGHRWYHHLTTVSKVVPPVVVAWSLYVTISLMTSWKTEPCYLLSMRFLYNLKQINPEQHWPISHAPWYRRADQACIYRKHRVYIISVLGEKLCVEADKKISIIAYLSKYYTYTDDRACTKAKHCSLFEWNREALHANHI